MKRIYINMVTHVCHLKPYLMLYNTKLHITNPMFILLYKAHLYTNMKLHYEFTKIKKIFIYVQ